jgi:hypothetical protein
VVSSSLVEVLFVLELQQLEKIIIFLYKEKMIPPKVITTTTASTGGNDMLSGNKITAKKCSAPPIKTRFRPRDDDGGGEVGGSEVSEGHKDISQRSSAPLPTIPRPSYPQQQGPSRPVLKQNRVTPQRCRSMNNARDITRPERPRRSQQRPPPQRSLRSILKQDSNSSMSSMMSSSSRDSTDSRVKPGRATSFNGVFRDGRGPTTSTSGIKARRRNRVSFDDMIYIRKVPPVSELTQHPERLWFQAHELEHLTGSSLELVDRVEAAKGSTMTEEGKKLCLRGLEGWLMDRSIERAVRKKGAWSSVLGEQSAQMEQGTFDDKAVRNAYTKRSFKCRMEAARRAQQDAKDVEAYLKTTRQYCRRAGMISS